MIKLGNYKETLKEKDLVIGRIYFIATSIETDNIHLAMYLVVLTLEKQGKSNLVERNLYLLKRPRDFTYQICIYLRDYAFYPLLTMYLRPLKFDYSGRVIKAEYDEQLKEMHKKIIEEELQQIQKNRVLYLTNN